MEKNREETETNSHSPIDSPNGHHARTKAKLKPGTGNPVLVSRVGDRHMLLDMVPATSHSALTRSWSQRTKTGTKVL